MLRESSGCAPGGKAQVLQDGPGGGGTENDGHHTLLATAVRGGEGAPLTAIAIETVADTACAREP